MVSKGYFRTVERKTPLMGAEGIRSTHSALLNSIQVLPASFVGSPTQCECPPLRHLASPRLSIPMKLRRSVGCVWVPSGLGLYHGYPFFFCVFIFIFFYFLFLPFLSLGHFLRAVVSWAGSAKLACPPTRAGKVLVQVLAWYLRQGLGCRMYVVRSTYAWVKGSWQVFYYLRT